MSYFPVKVQITDKKSQRKGEEFIATKLDDIPSGVAFRVLATNVETYSAPGSSKSKNPVSN